MQGNQSCLTMPARESKTWVPQPYKARNANLRHRYCGIHNPSCVVKCLICSKWFCNARGSGNSAHIVNHLVKARHKEVQLHPESTLGDTTLECYLCGTKNVFLLGFIPAKSDTVVVLLCRQPCAMTSPKDMTWDTSKWTPLIEEKAFLSWLVEHPSVEEQLHARPIRPATMARLEETWKTNPKMDLVQLVDEIDVEEEPNPVLLKYEDSLHYQNTFGPLVKMESDYDKRLKEEQSEDDLTVTWDEGIHHDKLFASFSLRKIESGDVKLAVGDEMRLRYTGGLRSPWEAVGFVLKIPNNQSDEVRLEIRKHGNEGITNVSIGFSADYVWKATSYDRMQLAMRSLVEDHKAMDNFILHTLLGFTMQNAQPLKTTMPKKWSAPGLPELNPSQVGAIRAVMQNRLSLIQGPPGTGKTVTSATIIYHLAKTTKSQVLVCAPSNVAVDQLCERIHYTGLKVVRVTAKSREDVESSVKSLALHEQVQMTNNPDLVKYNELQKEFKGDLRAGDEKRLKNLIKKLEREILANADVVCCTCVGAGDPRLAKIKFRNVLIDESTQSAEPECLIPLVLGAKQVVLVGDHKQLGPVIMNKKAAKAGLNQSLFERLVNLHQVPIRLNIQYRMHPCLSEFPSNMFYDGTLQNGITHESRTRKELDFPWPVVETPMMFWRTGGNEEISPSGTSFLNRAEAQNVEKTITRFFKAGVKPSEVGVITPYEGQRSYIVSTMQNTGHYERGLYKMVEVASVDAFQGREKDFIVLSCVRSNEGGDIGFLSDPRRLNVALTRAKYGVVILGNPKALCKHELWYNLLTHFKDRKCFVEGPLTNLQTCMLQFSRPRPSYRQKNANNNNSNNNNHNLAFSNAMRPKHDFEYSSTVSYVPDDVSSIHSSQFGGGASLNGFPNMFSGFTPEQWPGLPGVPAPTRGNRVRGRAPESIAGESVANSEYTDTTNSVIGGKGVGQGGVSLGAGLHDAVTGMRPVSYTQSDRLRQYIESNGRMGPPNGYGRRYDDDEKSISTAFQSQYGGGYS